MGTVMAPSSDSANQATRKPGRLPASIATVRPASTPCPAKRATAWSTSAAMAA